MDIIDDPERVGFTPFGQSSWLFILAKTTIHIYNRRCVTGKPITHQLYRKISDYFVAFFITRVTLIVSTALLMLL